MAAAADIALLVAAVGVSLLAGRPGTGGPPPAEEEGCCAEGGTAGDIDREEEDPVGEGEGRGLGEGPPLKLLLVELAGSVLPGRPSESLGDRPPS